MIVFVVVNRGRRKDVFVASLGKEPFKSFKPFNRFAPFKPFVFVNGEKTDFVIREHEWGHAYQNHTGNGS